MDVVKHKHGTARVRVPGPIRWAFVQVVLSFAGVFGVLSLHWLHRRKPIHSIFVGWYTPLYYPLLNLLAMLFVAAIVLRGRTLLEWVRVRRKATRVASTGGGGTGGEPGSAGAPGTAAGGRWDLFQGEAYQEIRLRLGWIDGVLVVSLTVLFLLLLEAFRHKTNPTGACVGSDYVTFLGNIVAVGLERWDIYNPAKRLPYPWIAAVLARLSGKSFLEAGQWVSLAAVSLIPGATYLAAIPAVGRLNGALAALLVSSVPLLHPFATHTGSYGLFALSVTLVLAAGTWSAALGGAARYWALGVLAALCVQIQTKGVVMATAVVGASVLVRPGWRQRLVCGIGVVVPMVISTFLTSLLPVSYPSLGAMTAINRQEVHRDMPYRWPRTREPDLENPSPISRYLPGFARGGEIESFAAVVLAPPDVDIVRVGRHLEGDQWVVDAEVVPETTIPPIEVRVRGNLRVLGDKFPGVNVWLAVLLVIGVVDAVVPRRGRPRSRSAAGWVMTASLLPLWGPLSLNLHTRYLLPFLPPAFVLVVGGVQGIVRGWLRRRHPVERGLASALITWFCASLAVSLFTGSPRMWLKPSLEWSSLPTYLGVADLESHVSRSVATQQIARWVATSLPRDASVFDCTALGVYLLMPEDGRWRNAFLNSVDRDARCRALVQAGAPSRDTYVIASNSSEFRGPDTLSLEELLSRSAAWTLIRGVAMDSLAPVHAEEEIDEDVILVFRAAWEAPGERGGP